VTQEPHSIAEVTAALLLWAKRSGPGLALVEFASEYARQQVFEQVQDDLGQPFAELVFHSTGDLERDVRHLVDQLEAEKSPLVSVRGIADAFLGQEERRRVLGLLNFLRESISRYPGKQVWWVTPEVGRLLQREAPDWHSWFSPRLELREETVVPNAVDPLVQRTFLSMDRAAAIVADARERLAASAGNASTAERWRQLADPAIVALQQAADLDGARALREEFLDLIYGEAHDARRHQCLRDDIDLLMRERFYGATSTLAGDGAELVLAGTAPERRREGLLQLGRAKRRSGDLVGAERSFGLLVADLVAVVTAGGRELENDLAQALMNWGNSLLSLRRLPEAMEAYDRAIEIRERLVHEGRIELECDLARALTNRGVSLRAPGRLTEALVFYDRAITIFERLVDGDRRELENDLALALMNRGNALVALGRLIEALESHDRVIAIRDRLVAEGRLELESDLARILTNQGVSLRAIGRLTEAVRAYDRAITIFKKLVAEGRRELLPWLGMALANRGQALGKDDRNRGCSDLMAARRTYAEAVATGQQGLDEGIAHLTGLLHEFGCESDSEDPANTDDSDQLGANTEPEEQA
jgi:tetratricopeptide (TPR) repeat protein